MVRMNKKKKSATAVLGIICILLNIAVIFRDRSPILNDYLMNVAIKVNSDVSGEMQLFYSVRAGYEEGMFTADNVKSGKITADNDFELSFDISAANKYIRLDLPPVSGAETRIYGMTLRLNGSQRYISADGLRALIAAENQLAEGKPESASISCLTEGDDAYIVFKIDELVQSVAGESVKGTYDKALKAVICILMDAAYVLFLFNTERVFGYIYDIIHSRALISRLARNDLKSRFAGSYLGVIWSFIQPIVTVLVYWFVFQIGFKSSDVVNSSGTTVPFILWFIAGIVPWFYYSDTWNMATNVLIEYSYLVKKVVFNIDILPLVKLLSGLIIHVFFVGLMLILYIAYGMFPGAIALQLIYYSFCMFVMILGQSYLTSACVVFFRDLTQFINIWMQLGVWMTPIMWNIDTIDISGAVRTIFKLNPMYYIVQGYRDTLINGVWFWDRVELTTYFWVFTAAVFILGRILFKRLKPHFADIL